MFLNLFSATLGSGDVDICLVPEVPSVLDGEKGCLPHLWDRVKQKGYAVVVVAEGAGEELLGESTETDASGNKKLPMIGEFLKSEIGKYFKGRGEEATVKYIDPSYMIRSVPANATDSLYCMQLGQNAVHGKLYLYVWAQSKRLQFVLIVYTPLLMTIQQEQWLDTLVSQSVF